MSFFSDFGAKMEGTGFQTRREAGTRSGAKLTTHPAQTPSWELKLKATYLPELGGLFPE